MYLEKIMGSKAKVRIIKALSSGKELQLSEIKRMTNLSLSTVHEAIKDLVSLRIVMSRNIGKTRLYRINQGNYFSKIVVKAVLEERKFYNVVLKKYINKIKSSDVINITVFGSYARGEEFPKDIDILVVTKNRESLKENIIEMEGFLLEKYDVHVSTIVLEEKDIKTKFRSNDKFILNVIAEGKKLYGKDLGLILHG